MGENQAEKRKKVGGPEWVLRPREICWLLWDLRYGSEEAIDFAVDIQKTLAVEAYRASVHLAKDRGSFKIFDAKREENNPYHFAA